MESSGSEGWWAYFSSESTSTNPASSGPVPHGNHASVSTEAEGAASPGRPAYEPEEMIGGDSILSIQRRLLAKDPLPSAEAIYLARINAEDLFEVKVDIIRRMTVLDPTGDWMRQGARALDNPRTATGESSLERLYCLLGEIDRDGVHSNAFRSLTNKVVRRRVNLDEESAA